MTKEQFKTLKVGDIVEYNSRGILVGCQFKITKLGSPFVDGTVTKKGTSGKVVCGYPIGALISSDAEYITLVNSEPAAGEPFATLALSVQEAAVLLTLIRKVGGSPYDSVRKIVDSIHTKLRPSFGNESIFHISGSEMFEFTNSNVLSRMSLEELDASLIKKGFLKTPEKPKAPTLKHKVRGPDGKFAPKNYRRVMYPEHGDGELVERHILLGDFIKGTSGTNVSVQEWDGQEWKPKTYSATKIKPAN